MVDSARHHMIFDTAQSILMSTNFLTKLNINRGSRQQQDLGGYFTIWCHDVDSGYDTSTSLIVGLIGQLSTEFAMSSSEKSVRVASQLAPNGLHSSQSEGIGNVAEASEAVAIKVERFVLALHGLGKLGSLFFLIILAKKCELLDEESAQLMIGVSEARRELYRELEKGASEAFDRSIAKGSPIFVV